MLDALPAIAGFFWEWLGKIFNLYTTCSILSGFFALWVLDRIFGIFDLLKK